MSSDMKITVDQLFDSPFSSRCQSDKVRVVLEGRPTPQLKMRGVTNVGNAEISAPPCKRNVYDELVQRRRELNNSLQSMYDSVQWLTGSATTGLFYCWPCLLFQPSGVWNKTGISVSSFSTKLAEGHEKTALHIEAMFLLQIFIDQNCKRDDQIKCIDKNPGAFNRLTDVVYSVISVQLTPVECDNSLSSLSIDVEKCLKMMDLFRKYDSSKFDSDDTLNFMKTSPEVTMNMVHAIAKVMKLNIAKEIVSCKHVSLILSLHSNVKLKAQISTILRYVKNGKIYERFLGFTHVFRSASVDSIYCCIMRIIDKFKISSKCVAISLDGGILPSDEVGALLKRLKISIPRFIFVPWHSHIVDYAIQKSLYKLPKCEHFFKCMSAMESYFCENSELCKALYDFVAENELESITIKPRCAGNWCVTSQFMAYVLKYRLRFVQFFDSVISNSSKWDSDAVAKAVGFREYLQDLMSVFLLSVFYKIFRHTNSLNVALISVLPERNFGCGMVHQLTLNLNRMLVNDFNDLWIRVVKEVGENVHNVKKGEYVRLFKDIIWLVIAEIETRYNALDNFKFCSMFDFEAKSLFERTTSRLQNLMRIYPIDFNQPQVISEMELVVKHNSFSKKNVYDFHRHLHESNLKHTFKALFDISELILALPFKRASPTSDTSILITVGKWCFGPERLPTYDDVSIVYVEFDYLRELKQSPTFYQEVNDNFPRSELLCRVMSN